MINRDVTLGQQLFHIAVGEAVPQVPAHRPMPLSLAGDLVKVDLGWAVVELTLVGGAFKAVVVSAISFDHPRICSVSSRGVGSFGDFVGGFGECGGECFRRKARLVGDLAADRAVAADKG
jgi:hypothetical protein